MPRRKRLPPGQTKVLVIAMSIVFILAAIAMASIIVISVRRAHASPPPKWVEQPLWEAHELCGEHALRYRMSTPGKPQPRFEPAFVEECTKVEAKLLELERAAEARGDTALPPLPKIPPEQKPTADEKLEKIRKALGQ